MLHLPIERIAELVDGGGTLQERDHLLTCAPCTRELEAYRRLVAIAGDERRRIAPPLTDWESLSERLRAEGMLAPASGAIPSPGRRGAVLTFLRRAAVVVVFVGSGGVLGRMSAGVPVMEALAWSSNGAVPVGTSDSGTAAAPARLASDAGVAFATPEDALRALEAAQRQYEVAATWLATHDTSSSELAPEQYRTRLAALDRTAETMQQAMHEAPADPYINQYYFATLRAREQTLRRLGTTLPVGSKLGRF